jgi:glycosyltransferase involved in cell wall biosynthesis
VTQDLMMESRSAPALVSTSASAPMRILLWAPKGAGLHYGGPGMTVYRLFARAQPGRFAITLVHGFHEQERYPCFAEQHFLSKMPTDARSFALWELRSRKWLRRHARDFDVFLGLQGWHYTVSAAAFAKRLGLPAAVRPGAFRRDFADKRSVSSFLGLPAWRRRTLRDLSAVIAISKDIAAEMHEYGVPTEKIAYIPNGVDVETFHPAGPREKRQLRAKLGWPDIPTILFSGALVRRKRPDLLIDAVSLLKRRGKDAHLVLVGPQHQGDTAEQVRTRCEELGLAGRVSMLGFRRDVSVIYRAADIFCLPSHSEGMANAMLEAMASGLPSVVTDVSGVRDVLEHGVHGVIVGHCPEMIAEAFGGYIDNPELAASHGTAARELILREYNAAITLDRYERVFRCLRSGRPVG